MPSFVESATLLLVDKSSANIKKINAELKALLATAKKLNNLPIKLTGLSKATAEVNKLKAAAEALNRRPVNMRVQLTGAGAVQSQINALARNRRMSITAGLTGANWRGFGSQIGFGFRASLGNALFQGARGLVREGVQATLSSEDAAMRIRQAGFNEAETAQLVEMSRQAQDTFKQVPAALLLDAVVEAAASTKAYGHSLDNVKPIMERVGRNAQIMAITFKDAARGTEEARELERLAEIKGIDPTKVEQIRKLQDEAMRAIISSGGKLGAADAVRAGQQLKQGNLIAMSPEGFADILTLRDEGGMASTASVRMFLNDLTRASLNRVGKEKMAAAGLRTEAAGNAVFTDVAHEARFNPTDFAWDVLKDDVERFGGNLKDISSIMQVLTDKIGFTTSGAEFAAQALQQRDQIVKQRIARGQVDLTANLSVQTFRGSMQALTASFDTAIARNLDAFAPKFANELDPIRQAIDTAGKQTEQGEFQKGLSTLFKASQTLLSGDVGTAIKTAGTVQAIASLLSPVANPLEKAAGMLQLAAIALMDAAGNGKRPETMSDRFSFEPFGGMLGGIGLKKGGIAEWVAKGGLVGWFLGEAKASELTPEMDALTDRSRAAARRRIELSTQMAEKETQLAVARQKVAEITDVAKVSPGEEMNLTRAKGDVGDLEAEVSRLAQSLRSASAESAALTAQVDKAMTPPKPADVKKPLQTVDAIIRDFSRIAKVGRIPKAQRTEDVKWLQEGIGLPATGVVDDQTKKAIMEFQQKLGLTMDGIIGRQTDSAIKYLKGLDYFGELVTKTGQPPVPTPRPSTFIPDAGKRPDALMLSPQVEAAIDGITTSGIQAADTMNDGITSGGQTAAGAMRDAITSAGNTAAAAIRNATSNINVNVNANVTGGGADTGPVGGSTGPAFGGPR